MGQKLRCSSFDNLMRNCTEISASLACRGWALPGLNGARCSGALFRVPRLRGSMNKLTATLIIGLMSCALCGCMSEQEWKEWNQKRDQEHIEWQFSMRGVKYPGTREEYVSAHSIFEMEDIIAWLDANRESLREGYVMVGSLDRDDIKIGLGETYEFPYELYKEWKFFSLEECEVYRIKNIKKGKYEFFEAADIPMDSNEYDLDNKELFTTVGEVLQRALADGWSSDSVFFYQNILGKFFVCGMTLEQVRVSLQDPLHLEYSSPGYEMYSGWCKSPNYSDECSIHYTFINGRLNDWSKHYSRRISY